MPFSATFGPGPSENRSSLFEILPIVGVGRAPADSLPSRADRAESPGRGLPMNVLGSLVYAVGLIPGALAIVGNLRGGPWALGATAFFGALCVADWFVRESRRDPPGRGDLTPDLILSLHV